LAKTCKSGLLSPVALGARIQALYVPTYWMNVIDGNDICRSYYGCLMDVGGGISFQQAIKKYYDGTLFGLLFSFTWGGFESRDVQISEDIGLAYRSFRCDIDGDKRSFYIWRDDGWRPTSFVNFVTSVFEFLSQRPELIADLWLEIGTRWKGGLIQADSVGEHKLRAMADVAEGSKRGKYRIGDIHRCDICGHDFDNDTFMADAATGTGPWACMCSRCFADCSAEIGWGKGQLYMRTAGGWLQVGGFGSDEMDD
jgi:hypothetical protein